VVQPAPPPHAPHILPLKGKERVRTYMLLGNLTFTSAPRTAAPRSQPAGLAGLPSTKEKERQLQSSSFVDALSAVRLAWTG